MTDTRSPEQRRTDELSLAWVARRGYSRPSPAYEAGRAAGLDGWTSRGTPGMEAHEQGCDDAQRNGHDAEWAAGHAQGLRERAT